MTKKIAKFIGTIRRWVNVNIGYDVVHFSGQHNLRSHLTTCINEYKIDTIFDVGANEGQFGEFVRGLGFSGKIYSFEPVDSAFQKLQSISAADHDWIIFNFALGSGAAESYINVSEFTSFSSILTPSDYALEHWANSRVDHQQKILIKTLDQCVLDRLIPESGRTLLKMDTQGYDLEVFRGGQKVLDQVSVILSELSLIAVYNDMPSYKDSLATYEAAGFSVSGFYPITRNKDLSLNEVDCVLAKTARHPSKIGHE